MFWWVSPFDLVRVVPDQILAFGLVSFWLFTVIGDGQSNSQEWLPSAGRWGWCGSPSPALGCEIKPESEVNWPHPSFHFSLENFNFITRPSWYPVFDPTGSCWFGLVRSGCFCHFCPHLRTHALRCLTLGHLKYFYKIKELDNER